MLSNGNRSNASKCPKPRDVQVWSLCVCIQELGEVPD